MLRNIPMRHLPLVVIALLALTGGAIASSQTWSFYLMQEKLSAASPFCQIGENFDCSAIELSRYAEFVHGIPLSLVALVGFSLIFLAAAIQSVRPYSKILVTCLLALSAIAAVVSVFYLYIMVFEIRKICVLCLCIDVIDFSIFAAAIHVQIILNNALKTRVHLIES